MKINLTNPITKQTKQVKIGFSWTVLFFGCFPMLFRADWLWFLLTLIASLVLAPIFGIINIVLAIVYNKQYIKGLMAKGFVPADEASKNAMLSKGIVVPE